MRRNLFTATALALTLVLDGGLDSTELGQSQGAYGFLFNSLYYGPAAAGR